MTVADYFSRSVRLSLEERALSEGKECANARRSILERLIQAVSDTRPLASSTDPLST
jgi:hypothetical protein